MTVGAERAIQTGLGPIGVDMVPTSTAPLSGSGILNNTVGLTSTKVLSARAGTATGGRVVRRVKLSNFHASNILAWRAVIRDTANPNHTATGGGTATDGGLITAGQAEFFNLAEHMDLYIVASAITTPYQLQVNES